MLFYGEATGKLKNCSKSENVGGLFSSDGSNSDDEFEK